MSPKSTLTLVVLGAFLVLPWVEFWLMVQVGASALGATVWCLFTGAAGWWFARREELSLWTELESDLQNRRVPTAEGIDAMLQLIGAWGLILPGLLTDVLGCALLLPPVRAALVEPIRRYLKESWLAG
jgi:UPF0716 protein FxsA